MSADDLVNATRLLVAIGAETHMASALVIPGAPYSKSRPRFSRRGHTYVKPEDREAEDLTAKNLHLLLDEPATGNLALVCVFYRPNRQRIDVDNMLKHVCDAANGVLWVDDSQCTALYGVAELDVDNPRTVVAIAPHVSTLTRGSDATRECELCDTPFNIVGVSAKRKYCSKECSNLARTGSHLEEPVPCAQCGEPFKRTTKTQKMCSTACANTALAGRNRSRGTPLSVCPICGVTLAHHRGGRCRDCWRKDPSGQLSMAGGGLS